jgi:hypothetical protein
MVATSTTEAEFIAAATAVQEALWFQEVILCLNMNDDQAIHTHKAVPPYNIRYTRIRIYTYIYVYASMWPCMSYSLGQSKLGDRVCVIYKAYDDIRLLTRRTRNCVGGGLIHT